MKRRSFISLAAITATANAARTTPWHNKLPGGPIVISTWAPNVKANEVAFTVLNENGSALDAVHQGVMIPEADPDDQSVGYGGLPDRDGRVTLDACIMDHMANIGAVFCLEGIKHPISVARLVMEKTPHVQLSGEGALKFAIENGFKPENLLTEKSEKAWKNWLKTAKYNPMTTIDNLLERIKYNHDTIGMLALDSQQRMAGACSTSGMAFKMRGRVGDSPIIGAGLYVDNEVGAATATGVGEELVRICGSHTVVEYLRQGYEPEEACRQTLLRLVKIKGEKVASQLQVAIIALTKDGLFGACSLTKDFTMAVHNSKGAQVISARSLF